MSAHLGPAPPSADHRVRALVAAYEALDDGAATLDALLACYAADAAFRDPFNDVRGRAAIRRVFEHMRTQVRQPRFVVTSSVCEDDVAFLRWDFRFNPDAAGRPRCVDGVSRIAFDGDGRVASHIDFWDPARELYESVPLLGSVLRFVRRRLSASSG